ncbi:nickel ABC transporter substrate-binding protein [Desulfosporosinus burensis]
MKRFAKLLVTLLILSLTMSSMVGCSKESNPGAQSGSSNVPQELTIAYGKDTDAKSIKGTGDMLLKIFSTDRLVELIDGKVQPSLATSWDIKDNGNTIIFHLRKDVKFSDGTPFTAEAVKFTYDRLIKFNHNQWTQIGKIEKIEVIDPYTVVFHIVAGQGGYLVLTSFGEYQSSILSPNSVEPKGDPGAPFSTLIGTGPWKVIDYKKDQYTVFAPNDYYYGKKATLQKVTVKDIPKAEGRVLALKSGDVDVIVDYYHGGSAYTPRNLLKSLKDDGFQVLKKEMPMTTALAFNYKKAPWNNVTLRQGINYAINKDDLVALFDGWITPAKEGIFSATAPFVKEAGVKEYPYNVEEAKKLIKQAGFPEGYKPKMIVQSQNPDEVKLAELIKFQLAQVGIDVQLDVLEAGVYTDRQKKGDWDLRTYYIGGPGRRAYTRLDGRFNPTAVEFGGSGYFSSPQITTVLNKAVSSFDEQERLNSFKTLYSLFKEEAGGVPLYYDAVFVVAKSNIKNIEYVSSEPRFDSVVVEKKK